MRKVCTLSCSTSHIPSNIVAPPGSIPCPLCRHGILSLRQIAHFAGKEIGYMYPLAFVHRACFIPVMQIAHHLLQRSERIVLHQFLRIFSVQLPVVHFLLLPSLCAPATMVLGPRLKVERQKCKMDLQDVHNLHRSSRIKLKDRDWREQPVQTCSGAGGAAVESINAIQK
ncbi:hypothetical protein ERO13_1Z049460v2 [Gossypium hirsutum]|nr:hypothetical protein ERO13_1Z049460v2 [Gossypium hirsutum]